ncbi:MAG: hypothetical protein JKX76_14385, partial [Colwellia sp.]|nr:hypothetical protein [Colwellia sp.]
PGFGQDPYIHYFWSQCPDLETLLPQLESVYEGLYNSVVKYKPSKATSSKTNISTKKIAPAIKGAGH